jgi:hypothetical protein
MMVSQILIMTRFGKPRRAVVLALSPLSRWGRPNNFSFSDNGGGFLRLGLYVGLSKKECW